MNNEPDFEKVMEIDFHGVTYLITIKAYPQSLSIELQDKYSGQIWINSWQPHFIEEITKKTGNYKKYSVFLKMLITAFTKNSQSVYVDILTHHDIQMQNARRNPNFHKTTDSLISQRRYVILSYMVQFDKVHYPLALNFNKQPQTDRLKLTIRRLSQQLRQMMGNSNIQNSSKQITIIKHENELLKAKLRTQVKNDSKQNQNNENRKYISELQEEKEQFEQKLLIKQKQIQKYKEELEQCRNMLKSKNNLIQELNEQIKKQKDKLNRQSEQLYKVYQNQINRISSQVKQLASQLQHERQNEKKSKLKISNLQKQLQNMMELKSKSYNKNNYNRYDTTPRSKKSNNSSLKGSVSGINNINRNEKKKILYPRKNSVENSQTFSSRMRRQNNNRSSPFRQGNSNLSNSAKKNNNRVGLNKSKNKFNNVSNLNDKKNNRSRSKSVKRQSSPQQQVTQSQYLMTQGYGSDSDSQQRNEQIMTQLRNRKTSKLFQSKNRLKNKKQKNSNALQEKISNIAQMLKKVRRNQ